MLRIYIRKFESSVHLLQYHEYRWRTFKRVHKESGVSTLPPGAEILWSRKLKLLVIPAAGATLLFGLGITLVTWVVKGPLSGLIMAALFIITAPSLFIDALGLGLLLSFPYRRITKWIRRSKPTEN